MFHPTFLELGSVSFIKGKKVKEQNPIKDKKKKTDTEKIIYYDFRRFRDCSKTQLFH